MTAQLRDGVRTRRPGLLLSVVLASALVTSLVGCSSSGDGRSVPLPPGGVPIGNLVCTSNSVPDTNMVPQGTALVITFTLTDVNQHVVGRLLPISFDVIGGYAANPPTETDTNGTAVVTFVADATYTGPGRVRLIQPDAQLDCDFSFTVYQPGAILRAAVVNGVGATVTAEDACGTTELNVQRNQVRKIVYHVTRINPVTHAEQPVAGAMIHLHAVGMSFTDETIGPTDANGMVTKTVTPFPTDVGLATITADVVRPDANHDGVPDSLPSNTCTIGFDIISPICDANGVPPTPVYRTAAGVVRTAPLRPGENADVTAQFVVNGAPLAGYPVLVSPGNGFLSTTCGPVPPSPMPSSVPLHLMTAPDGSICVKYTKRVGYSGPDMVTFQSDPNTVTCVQIATIDTVTCQWALSFSTPPTSGMSTVATMTLDTPGSADYNTALGQLVALSATGGYFTAIPPYYPLVDDGAGHLVVMAVYNVTPGFTGPAQISASFPGGYPCPTVTKNFTVN